MFFKRNIVRLRPILYYSYNWLFHYSFDWRWLKHLSTGKFGFDEILTVLGTAVVDPFDLIEYFWLEHEVIGKFADITSFNHFVVNSIYSRLLFVGKVSEHILYINPLYFLLHSMPILNIENNFFDWDRAFYLRILYGSLIYKMNIWKIVFYFVNKWSKVNLLIAKSIKSRKNSFQLLPILFS